MMHDFARDIYPLDKGGVNTVDLLDVQGYIKENITK